MRRKLDSQYRPQQHASAGTAPCPDVESQLFASTCALSGCHAAATKMAGIDLQSAMVAARLRDVPATGGPGLLIDSQATDDSVLLTELGSTPPFGASMPPTRMLPPATVACVRAGIVAATSP